MIDSDDFIADKERLDDSLVAVKLVTGFDKVNTADLVSLRESAEFLEDFAIGTLVKLKPKDVARLLSRPIRIPTAFVNALTSDASAQRVRPALTRTASDTADAHRIAELQADNDALKSVYNYVMALHPGQFELAPVHAPVSPPAQPTAESGRGGGVAGGELSFARPEYLRIGGSALETLDSGQRQMLAKLGVDPASTPVNRVIDAVKRKWIETSQQLLPSSVPQAAKVYRVGAHVFALQSQTLAADMSGDAPPEPDFSHAITRPVGIGNLQVVRQELIGYEAGDISHIENVLEGELLRRSTTREEINELTITQETDTTQTEERDQQSTDRNELASETQKETGQQTTSSQDQTSSTDYGKLVENSKTNYARSVTDRAVNSLTQMVKQQRIQREKKTYTEKALHELDNRQGTKKVRGIYQWVDKKYKARIINYGKRLLYDVVVPEPAAFLIESLKNAVQPENFQLTKPVDPGIQPNDLNTSNYMYYASQYGVTGSVTPPPDELVQTVAHPESPMGGQDIKAFGKTWFGWYYGEFKIQVPQNYKAISGYVQRTNVHYTDDPLGEKLELFIGEYTFLRFRPGDITSLNKSFTMNGETGEIPVTVNSWDKVIQFNFAIGINCQRTDKALEQWQLKTHAAVMAGYQRQLADYQDKLSQYLATVRSQMALAQNYAHDPSVEEQELKKAFLFLLLGEHFGQAYIPTPDPDAIPPDPAYVRDWGAMVAFFERAFEWENIMYTYYPYFWGRPARWAELVLIQDIDPQFEAFLKAGAARVVIPARPGFEAALAHYQETGDIWMGEEIPDMFSDYYVSIIAEIKSRNFAPGDEICVAEWDVKLPTTLIMLKDDATLPAWKPSVDCNPPANP